MKKFIIITCFLLTQFLFAQAEETSAQKIDGKSVESTLKINFSDRQDIIKTIENFYIGDHTGSIKHKKLSMHEKGAYRYINNDGKYLESVFRLDSDNADPNYKEELLSIEIYDKLALVRLRLDQFRTKLPEYKLMTLHKADGQWKITSINWGFGITQ